MGVQYLVGDVFDRMAELEDNSVDLVLTSPPFLALRSYLPADHPDKAKEIGTEVTPAEFVDTLLRLTAEWRRLLAPHGTICIELGDTYSGSGGSGGDYAENGLREGQARFEGSALKDRVATAEQYASSDKRQGWPLAKSLTLTPEAYRFALAYGTNPHTGQPSPAGQWRVRNVIRWVRPNPPVGALGDKFRPATSELVVACISKNRYFDLDAVRVPADPAHKRPSELKRESIPGRSDQGLNPLGPDGQRITSNPAGAPPLDWWKISPKGYAGAHYAVWPSELCVKPIKAMSPRSVCITCGEPRRRITETLNSLGVGFPRSQHPDHARGLPSTTSAPKVADRHTLGWSDCGHDNWRPGIVLDPFAGTGTTLAVAHGHGRDAIGIDLDPRNAQLAEQRIGGLFLEVIV